jgi:hypothetical protein
MLHSHHDENAVMKTQWQAIQEGIRERGWPAAALYGLDRFLRRLHGSCGLVCYRFLAQPLRAEARLPARRGQQFAFRLLQSPEPVLAELGRPGAVIARRFAQGAQCLLGTRAQALAGCIWFVQQRYREDEVRVDYVLPADCVWDFDVYVAPAERLGFLFARQWDVLDALLRPMGLRHSISRVNLQNPHSLASHRGAGARDVGWALFVCLFGRQLMLSSLAPYVGFGGRPALQMRA